MTLPRAAAARAARRIRDWVGVTATTSHRQDGLPIATIVDTAVASMNLGDQIIMEAVDHQLAPLLEGAFVHRVASHEVMRSSGRRLVDSSDIAIVGGTNLVGAGMLLERVWKVSPADALARRRFVLMGVGWKNRPRATDAASRWLLRRILSRDRLHSVRDGYTRAQLADLGIDNAVDTGCPTLWDLSEKHCEAIPRGKAPAVVVTLNRQLDPPGFGRRLAAYCATVYDRVFFWPQSPADHRYQAEMPARIEAVPPSLAAYDELLWGLQGDLDYVGTRLHGGIRALQAGRRALIAEVDHRTSEMAKSCRLPTVDAADWDGLTGMVEGAIATRVRLDVVAIQRFKDSTREAVAEAAAR